MLQEVIVEINKKNLNVVKKILKDVTQKYCIFLKYKKKFFKLLSAIELDVLLGRSEQNYIKTF